MAVGRHVNFTTTRGSWMSLDVSPDGKTIVFDLLGDLYTLPVTGGTATRLTSGMAMDVQPRFRQDEQDRSPPCHPVEAVLPVAAQNTIPTVIGKSPSEGLLFTY